MSARVPPPTAVLIAVRKALACTSLDGRAVLVNDSFTQNAILLERSELLDKLAEDMPTAVSPQTLAELRGAPTCMIPVVWKIGNECGVALLQPVVSHAESAYQWKLRAT